METTKKESVRGRKATHKKRNIIVISIVSILIVLSISGYIIYSIYRQNTYVFLQELSQYDESPASLSQASDRLISKAKTPVQYLMLLKRLDNFELVDAYRNTLARALYRYPKIQSFLALAVEYHLTYYDGDVFTQFFKHVDTLWNNYPNLVRLYYIDQFEDKSVRYKGDEILDIFYDIHIGNYTWSTFKLLWELTDEPVFLYLASVQAESQNRYAVAKELYDLLPAEWKSLNTDYYIEMAWVMKGEKSVVLIQNTTYSPGMYGICNVSLF